MRTLDELRLARVHHTGCVWPLKSFQLLALAALLYQLLVSGICLIPLFPKSERVRFPADSVHARFNTAANPRNSSIPARNFIRSDGSSCL